MVNSCSFMFCWTYNIYIPMIKSLPIKNVDPVLFIPFWATASPTRPGKHTNSDGKSPSLSSVNQRTKWAMFNSELLNYQRVYVSIWVFKTVYPFIVSIASVRHRADRRWSSPRCQGEFNLKFSSTYTWLVVLPILKTMKINGKDYPIYYGK